MPLTPRFRPSPSFLKLASAAMAALSLLACLAASPDAAEVKPYRLTILHTNDIHARIAGFNRFGQICTAEESDKGECFGGYPRVAAAVEALRKKGGNTLLLDAGDQFQGTLFYTLLKGRPERDCMNFMRYNAGTLGNHEFDDGPKVLADTFLDGLVPPMLAANVDASGDPALKDRLKPWTILNVGGRKVGLVGIANEDTAALSNPGPDIVFHKAEEPLGLAVNELAAHGADIVIALTHVGLERDKELAANVDGIDVIVGGHSHSLLSNTDPNAAGPYPVVVKSPSGAPVLIVQAEAWGKYLGELQVDFDAKGMAKAWAGAPLLMDASRPEDKTLMEKVRAWQGEMKPYLDQPRGKVSVDLTAECRFGECALGNALADAVRLSAKAQGVRAAFVNGGAIRSGLRAGGVSLGDLLTVYPFADNVATFELSGKDLLAVLEHGVSMASDPGGSGTGRFLQVSGIRYSFDPRKPEGRRIVTADILGPDGGYAPLDPEKTYPLATTGYLLRGGDGYAVLKERAKRVYAFGMPVSDAFNDFFATHSPVSGRLEGRIVRLGDALPK
ncbi:MAG: bifunctional metallophosphatase/5'-nucleotidase [Thermodesulfobacteriota bacterium]